MVRTVTCVFIAMAGLCVSNLARAQDDFSRVGCYLGAAGTVAFPVRDEDAWGAAEDTLKDALGGSGVVSNVSVRGDVSQSLGLHARAGCRTGWGGGELHFEWLQEFGVDDFEIEVGLAGDSFEVLDPKAKIDGWALTLDGKLYPLWFLEDRLPSLARRFQPFATVGVGYLTGTIRGSATVLVPDDGAFVEEKASVEVDEWDFAVRFGGGLEVYVTRNIAISVDTTYVVPVSDALEGFDYLSVGWGVLYRF